MAQSAPGGELIMEFSIDYRVNRVSTHDIPDTVVIDGAEESIVRKQVEVELHDEIGSHGSVTLRFFGAQAQAAYNGFSPLCGSNFTLKLDVPMPAMPTLSAVATGTVDAPVE